MIKDESTIKLMVDTVSSYVKERLIPIEEECAENDAIPHEIIDEIRELGLFGLSIPEEYGGLGLTLEEEMLVIFELCQASPIFRSVIGTNVGIGALGIIIDGTEEQKKKYLPKLASGELIGSFALTEPEAVLTPPHCVPRHCVMAMTISSTVPSVLLPMPPRQGFSLSLRALTRKTRALAGFQLFWSKKVLPDCHLAKTRKKWASGVDMSVT